ncbi:HlyD family secretion protein [Roseibium sp. TrichSKD4]|uniref:biotin/lipoyl-binding protein n=1 Tax=Roseibium sp. TrichSKD4 TaxID=744980 RepID=UPI0001E5684B|nr:biotin/lipoyl-binding protein [Roseibium sp. TrichSKD4]EFO31283.1 HlyD family secretion protein [Roseibium sp. TrichSKD4]
MNEVTIATRAHKLFVVIVALGLIAVFAWAQFTQIDIVTRGSGRVVPSLQNQFVQHLEGGIIREILVREGQFVKKGDVLLTIRDPFSRAEYEKAQKLLLSRQAELVRLEAESQNLPVLEFSQDMINAVPDVVADERDLFNSRQQSLEQQHLILEDHDAQGAGKQKGNRLEHQMIHLRRARNNPVKLLSRSSFSQ